MESVIEISNLILNNLTLFSVITLLIGYVILWIIVSIPVWLAGKALTGGKASFGDAMLATLAGLIIYVIVLFAVDFFLGAIIGMPASIWAYLLAFIAWIWVYKSSFRTGWLQGLGIAILAIIIFFILNQILGAVFGVVIPGAFFPPL